YKERLAAVPGVADLTYANWFGGMYEADRGEFFAQFAVDAESYFRVYPEYVAPPEEMQAFASERASCMIGRKLADRLRKKVGDTIVLKGTIYHGTWTFPIRAIYRGTRKAADETQMFFHYARLDEGLPEAERGAVGIYLLRLDDPAKAGSVSESIDRIYENSAFATKTETESAFALGFVSMMGNVALFVRAIGAAVVFTILLVAANTMMMSARERTREVGVLKAVGFSDRAVAGLLLSEACLLCLVGALVGCGVARFAFLDSAIGSIFPVFEVPWRAVGIGVAIAFVTGLVSGAVPAVAAARLSVATAIRRI
ncbi:MAG: ABC transporter permease, partial [Planctomycetota bacterium]